MKLDPMRSLAVAALLVGPEAGKKLKARWDRRERFYPRPTVSGQHGRASFFDPTELIAAAARAGDVSAEQVEVAFRALRSIAVRRCRKAR